MRQLPRRLLSSLCVYGISQDEMYVRPKATGMTVPEGGRYGYAVPRNALDVQSEGKILRVEPAWGNSCAPILELYSVRLTLHSHSSHTQVRDPVLPALRSMTSTTTGAPFLLAITTHHLPARSCVSGPSFSDGVPIRCEVTYPALR